MPALLCQIPESKVSFQRGIELIELTPPLPREHSVPKIVLDWSLRSLIQGKWAGSASTMCIYNTALCPYRTDSTCVTASVIALDTRIQGDLGWQFWGNWSPRGWSETIFGLDLSLGQFLIFWSPQSYQQSSPWICKDLKTDIWYQSVGIRWCVNKAFS